MVDVEQELSQKQAKLAQVEKELMSIKGVAAKFTKMKHQYDLKCQEVEHLKERLEQGSHHQQLEEINSLKENIAEYETVHQKTEEIKKKNAGKVKELEDKIKNSKQLREQELKNAEKGVAQAKNAMEESSKKMKVKY